MCRHIYVYWLQFEEFVGIMLPVIPVLPSDARHPGSIMKWGEKITLVASPFQTQILCEKEDSGLPATIYNKCMYDLN